MRIIGYDSHLFLISLLVLISLQNALAWVDHHHLLRKYIQSMIFNGWLPRKAGCKEELESIEFEIHEIQKKITGKSSSRTSMEPLREWLREWPLMIRVVKYMGPKVWSFIYGFSH